VTTIFLGIIYYLDKNDQWVAYLGWIYWFVFLIVLLEILDRKLSNANKIGNPWQNSSFLNESFSFCLIQGATTNNQSVESAKEIENGNVQVNQIV
jgi:hypothetical protein